jgi:alkylresorcinol/alkylpyrone synthase
MGWDVRDDGLAVIFSRDIPQLVRTQMHEAVGAFLRSCRLQLADIDSFICHPGGIKVIEALEEIYELEPGALVGARDVLRRYGNMSAATVMFVLEQALAREAPGLHLMSSLGPGFTAGFLTLDSRPGAP